MMEAHSLLLGMKENGKKPDAPFAWSIHTMLSCYYVPPTRKVVVLSCATRATDTQTALINFENHLHLQQRKDRSLTSFAPFVGDVSQDGLSKRLQGGS